MVMASIPALARRRASALTVGAPHVAPQWSWSALRTSGLNGHGRRSARRASVVMVGAPHVAPQWSWSALLMSRLSGHGRRSSCRASVATVGARSLVWPPLAADRPESGDRTDDGDGGRSQPRADGPFGDVGHTAGH